MIKFKQKEKTIGKQNPQYVHIDGHLININHIIRIEKKDNYNHISGQNYIRYYMYFTAYDGPHYLILNVEEFSYLNSFLHANNLILNLDL